MKTRLVKEFMVPLAEYATVSEDATLFEAVVALKKAQELLDQHKYRHRAILIYGKDKKIVGKVNLWAILTALEPKYDKMLTDDSPWHMGFSREFQREMIESFNLWDGPLDDICNKAANIKVKSFMVTPKKEEHIEADTPLGVAMHQLVFGHHQSLLVTKGDTIIGLLRQTDVFEVVVDAVMKCDLA